MRMSKLFGHTLREAPADAEMVSHRLLLRAGMIRPLGAGLYTYMPLGWRVLHKIEEVMRQEMNRLGGQEILMPVVHPASVWQSSGRWDSVDETLLRFQDRTGREMVLAMTHEEVVADLVRREIDSHRQLPVMIYHIQTKFRDEPRARGGLIRTREFVMKDAYSLHPGGGDLDLFYTDMLDAYRNIFGRCALHPLAVEADSGMMGGPGSHEFVLLNEGGEDTVMICESCGYAANIEQAAFLKPDQAKSPPEPIVEVATPGCKTIEAVARFVGVPTSRTLKAVFFATAAPSHELIFALIRGDLEVNEAKLRKALGELPLRTAEEAEIAAVGAVPGYASPLGLQSSAAHPLRVVADDSVKLGANFVSGANREGYHLTGVNYGRDFEADLLADIALAREGDRCPRCGMEEGGTLRTRGGIELGHCFKLGTRYSTPEDITYTDADGQERHVVMGSYGIGLGRLMAAIVEEHHDEYGIVWPPSVAPYTVHLVSLVKGAEVEQADAVAEELEAAGVEVLYDDRPDLSAGVKFNDADLIGCPLRLTVSRRSLKQGGVEAKFRTAAERQVISVEDALTWATEAEGAEPFAQAL